MSERLKDRSKRRIIEEMIRSVRPASGWKVMVVDKSSMRVISACCRMFDIMEEGVSLVENIDIDRQPLPNMDALYFLSPATKSIELLCKDFENATEPQYGVVHLFFTARITDDDLKKIKASPILSRVKCLKELNIDFLAYEQQCFHFDAPEMFHALFSPDVASRANELKAIADKMVSVCATLNDYPNIRYISNKDNNSGSLTHTIASLVQEKLDNLMRTSPEYANSINRGANQATLLILDRTIDPIAPIVHEFTYQAMAYDLLNIENDRYSFDFSTNKGESKRKEVILGETDALWPTLRHMFIADLLNYLEDKFNEFIKENKASKLYGGGKVESLKEMGDAMKAMPQYQEMLSKYSLHINMADNAMKTFHAQKLDKIANIEQDMATGEDIDGKAIKNVISNIAGLLSDPDIRDDDKIRLLMLFIISQEGIKDADRKKLMSLAKLTFEDQACVSNLRYLGVSLLKGTKGASKKNKAKDNKKKKRDDAPAYDLSRYVPILKQIVEFQIENNLPVADFPFYREQSSSSENNKVGPTSLRKSVQPKWADKETRKSEKNGVTTVGGRIIVFVAGGLTYSELRAAYELTNKYNREVVMGSTSLLTPTLFINELRNLKILEKADSI